MSLSSFKQKGKQAVATQLTLGDFIAKLQDQPQTNSVVFDFGGFQPDRFISYRGDYSQLALSYHSAWTNGTTVGQLLTLANYAVGEYFEGYKGGQFLMGADTPLWADNYGEASQTAIVDVVGRNGMAIIITAFAE